MLPLTLSLSHDISWQRVKGLLFDLDDTFLDAPSLLPEAYLALNALADSGLHLVLCTGRPASWAESLCRLLPISGAVAENGAIGFLKKGARVTRVDWAGAKRIKRQAELRRLVQRTAESYPHLHAADDAQGRISDFTFDIGEFRTASEAEVQGAIKLAREFGAQTSRSSVHLHFSFDREDKASGSLRLLKLLYEEHLSTSKEDAIQHTLHSFDQTRARHEWAYIGDSQNDAPCFAAFPASVAVANLKGCFSLPPQAQTLHPRGAGFVEFATALLQIRKN